MRRLIILIMGLCLMACGSVPIKKVVEVPKGTERSSTLLSQKVGGVTVGLVHNVNGTVLVYCTGVWVGGDMILTAGHCAQGVANAVAESELDVDPIGVRIHYIVESEKPEVGEEPHAVHLGRVVRVDVVRDLAVIKVDVGGLPGHGVVRLADISPGIGERLYFVGHTNGLYWTYVDGMVSAYRERLPVTVMGPYMQVTAALGPGNSGGGAFDMNGDLVGLCSFSTNKGVNTLFFIRLETIRKYLKEIK